MYQSPLMKFLVISINLLSVWIHHHPFYLVDGQRSVYSLVCLTYFYSLRLTRFLEAERYQLYWPRKCYLTCFAIHFVFQISLLYLVAKWSDRHGYFANFYCHPAQNNHNDPGWDPENQAYAIDSQADQFYPICVDTFRV